MAGESEAPVTESLIDDAAAPTEAAAGAESAAPANTDKPAESEKPAEESKPAEAGAEEGEKSLLDEAEGEDGKSPDEADGKADAKKDGAPETYAAFEVPDGMTLDESAVEKATPLFKELNLSQEQAQKLVSTYADLAKNTVEAIVAEQANARETLLKEWTNAAKNHPEFGKENLKASAGAVNKAIATYADSPEAASRLKNLLKETGFGNNPDLFALLARIGSGLSEDTHVNGDAAAQSRPKSLAERMWPSMNNQET